jgi:monodechloroaminopyrrolnitrin synthase
MSIDTLPKNPEFPLYEDVARRDPLGIDLAMAELPDINSRADTDSIKRMLRHTSDILRDHPLDNPADALAIIRDADFLTSSLLRHGENPFKETPELEEKLIQAGSVANTVPRGTVFTYAAANPTGERRRSFTGSTEEDAFISAVTRSVVALDGAVDKIGGISLFSTDQQLQEALTNSSQAMDEMIRSIVEVMRVVPPEYFTNHMRPYFESLTIGGKNYTGSGGAQIQLVAIDFMLWGCEGNDPEYLTFFEENVGYLTPTQQKSLEAYLKSNGEKGIVSLVTEGQEFEDASRQATVDLLKKIKKFRYPHRKVAQDNFKLRPDDAVGSGSYKPDILDVLIDKTQGAIERIEGVSR